MKATVYRVELLVIDHEQVSEQGMCDYLENLRYANARVMQIESRTVDWDDTHPLNHGGTQAAEFARLFRTAP